MRERAERKQGKRGKTGRQRQRARACARRERVLFIDSVTSTPQWIRQPKPDVVHDVCVCVCKCVLRSPRASQPLNIRLCLFSSTTAFSLRLMPLRLAVGATPAFQAPPLLHSRPSTPSSGLVLLTYPLHLGLHYVQLT